MFQNINIYCKVLNFTSLFLGMMALFNNSVSGDIYAWTAVLVLPINSALNPFLYTLSAIVAREVSYNSYPASTMIDHIL